MLKIKYKDKTIDVSTLSCMARLTSTQDGVISKTIVFTSNDEYVREWRFDTEAERDKVYNYILETFFIDIEPLIEQQSSITLC